VPKNTNNSPPPPTGVWRTVLLILARSRGQGAALERWALKRLGVWSGPTAKHREWARLATLEAKPSVPAEGDIRVLVRFAPPSLRRCA
jgi:hypothetical protein